jgi:hypothetical protein
VQLQLLSRAFSSLCIARNLLLVHLFVSHSLSANNLPSLRIANERLALCLEIRCLIANQDFVVPRLVAVTTVDTNIPRSGASVLRLAFPFNICGRALLVVEVSAERESKTLV